MWKWLVDTGASREMDRRALHENSKIHILMTQLNKPVDTCTLLLNRTAYTQQIRFVISQDGKWISCNNLDHSLERCHVDRDPEPVGKRPTHGKKETLCFFFCLEEPVCWEILAEGETVDSILFCKQLEELEIRAPSSQGKILSEFLHSQGKILLLMDNTRPHHAKITQQ